MIDKRIVMHVGKILQIKTVEEIAREHIAAGWVQML